MFGEPPATMTASGFADALELAARAWDLECSTARFTVAGTALIPADPSDGSTTVEIVHSGWETRGYQLTQAAVTEIRYETAQGRWFISDTDVFLNADTFDWTAANAPDLRAVLTHELGHALGIAHPCEHGSVNGEPDCATYSPTELPLMYPDYQSGAWTPRADDVAAACWLYPPDACATATCASGEYCNAGECSPIPMCATGDPCAYGQCSLAGETAGMCVVRGQDGAPCDQGNDCMSRLCLTSAHAGSYCTEACADDADCAGMQRCAMVGGAQVCAPLDVSGGCSVATATGAGRRSTGVALVGIALLAAYGRRRKRT